MLKCSCNQPLPCCSGFEECRKQTAAYLVLHPGSLLLCGSLFLAIVSGASLPFCSCGLGRVSLSSSLSHCGPALMTRHHFNVCLVPCEPAFSVPSCGRLCHLQVRRAEGVSPHVLFIQRWQGFACHCFVAAPQPKYHQLGYPPAFMCRILHCLDLVLQRPQEATWHRNCMPWRQHVQRASWYRNR
jgi:hypothetical protein